MSQGPAPADGLSLGRVVVVGAGTMGHGIAQVSAMAGHPVVLVDTTAEIVERGIQRVRETLQGGVDRGKVSAGERDEALELLTGTVDLAAAAGEAGLVIEAIPERMELKLELFRRLDECVSPDAILATNTSSLSVTEIQEGTARPGRVVGLHFFNPVHILKLVEVVRGRHTAEEVVAAATGFARQIEKEPIVVNDSPGFASSRLGIALGLEAMRMVEEGVAEPADIDRAMELGYRHPMGPLRLTDLVGLDVRLDIAEYLHAKLGAEAFRPPAILRRMVEEGRLGRKTGQGFYDWEDAS